MAFSDDEVAELAKRSVRGTLPLARPALRITEGRVDAHDGWSPVLEPAKAHVDVAVRATATVLTPAVRDGTATAFLVGDGLAVTCDFVVQRWLIGRGDQAVIAPGTTIELDFARGLGHVPGAARSRAVGVRFAHPYFPLVVLELDTVPAGAAVLDLASQLPADLSGRAVAVVSFALGAPTWSTDTAGAYQDGWGHLYVQPGVALSVSQPEGTPPMVTHDCTTAVGSAGGALLDIDTGLVLGVHAAASAQQGIAQPMWELARDPRVWPAALRFRPDPRPSWLDRWNAGAASPVREPDIATPRDPTAWSVDDVPIDWSRPEPRAMEQRLLAIDMEVSLRFAENVGVRRTAIDQQGSHQIVLRRLLNAAALAGLLRRLLEEVVADRQYAGVGVHLRTYL